MHERKKKHKLQVVGWSVYNEKWIKCWIGFVLICFFLVKPSDIKLRQPFFYTRVVKYCTTKSPKGVCFDAGRKKWHVYLYVESQLGGSGRWSRPTCQFCNEVFPGDREIVWRSKNWSEKSPVRYSGHWKDTSSFHSVRTRQSSPQSGAVRLGHRGEPATNETAGMGGCCDLIGWSLCSAFLLASFL